MPDRRLGVTIAADAANFIRGLRDAGQATKTLRGDLDQLSVTTKANAEAQVAATVKKTQRLRDEVVAYRGVAAAAQEGSREQVAAANLAARAESRLAASLGVTARESRSMSVSAAGAERDVSRAGRGALAGAGAFSSLGRSVAFASSWFLGGVGFVAGAKASISAASDLDEQMQRTDAVFGGSAAGVKQWSGTSVNAMGITKAAALDASDTIGTLLQNVGLAPAKGAAMSETFVQLASDMAAFKKVDPSVSLNALEAGLAGRTRSLKQFGLVIDTTTIKAEALSDGILKSSKDIGKIRDLQAKVSTASSKVQVETVTHGPGSAQAVAATLQLHSAQNQLAKAVSGTTGQLTAQQRTLAIYNLILKQTANQRGAFAQNSDQLAEKELKFHAALVETEAVIGNALLPMVSKYTTELGDWLGKSSNQAKIQRDVTIAVKDADTIIRFATGSLRVITTVTGGFKNALELLLALKVATTVSKWTTALAGIGTTSKIAAAETTASSAVIEADTVAIGAGATVAAGEVGGLRAALLGIGAPEVLAGIAAVYGALYGAKELGDALGKSSFFQGIQGDKVLPKGVSFGDVERVHNEVKAGKPLDAKDAAIAGKIGETPPTGSAKPGKSAPATGAKPPLTAGGAPSAVIAKSTSLGATGKIPLTKAQQAALSLATNPDDISALQAKVKSEDATLAWLKRRRASGKLTNAQYVQQATGILNDRAAAVSQIKSASKKAESADAFTLPAAIQVEQAKAATTAITSDDVKAAKDAKAFAQKIIASGKLRGAALADAYNEIASADQTIAQTAQTVPMDLQVKQALAATTPGTDDDRKVALEIRTWAEHLIKSQHLKGQALIDALGQVASADQILDQFTIPMKLQVAAAKAGITQTQADDVTVAKQIKAFTLAQIKSKKLQGQALIDAYNTISQENSIIGAVKPTKSVKLVSGKDIVAGMPGLTRSQKLAIEQRYDQAQAHGGHRPTGTGVLGQTITIIVHGASDPDRVADKVIAKIQRKGAAHVNRSRGTNAGRGYMGDH